MSILFIALASIAKKLLLTVTTETFLKWGFFFFGEMLVKSTKTTKDDEFFNKLKEAYNENSKL